jgi:hypothetical protein
MQNAGNFLTELCFIRCSKRTLPHGVGQSGEFSCNVINRDFLRELFRQNFAN